MLTLTLGNGHVDCPRGADLSTYVCSNLRAHIEQDQRRLAGRIGEDSALNVSTHITAKDYNDDTLLVYSWYDPLCKWELINLTYNDNSTLHRIQCPCNEYPLTGALINVHLSSQWMNLLHRHRG